MSLVYRPEKEGQKQNPPPKPPEDGDALKKDIEQQLKDNTATSENTNSGETATGGAETSETPTEAGSPAEPTPEASGENTGE